MSYGILLLRLVIGGTMAAHGAQKLVGWFDGPGLEGTRSLCAKLGYRAPALMAVALGLAEFGGGLLLAAGLLTPLGSFAVAIVMANAIWLVHRPNGFFNGNGGYEFNLALVAAGIAVAATGPGRFSFDHAVGWDDEISGLWWAVGVSAAALLGGAVLVSMGRRAAPAEQSA